MAEYDFKLRNYIKNTDIKILIAKVAMQHGSKIQQKSYITAHFPMSPNIAIFIFLYTYHMYISHLETLEMKHIHTP